MQQTLEETSHWVMLCPELRAPRKPHVPSATQEPAVLTMLIWDHLASVHMTEAPVYRAVTSPARHITLGDKWLLLPPHLAFCCSSGEKLDVVYFPDLLFIQDQLAEWSHLFCRVRRRTDKSSYMKQRVSCCDLSVTFKTLLRVYFKDFVASETTISFFFF